MFAKAFAVAVSTKKSKLDMALSGAENLKDLDVFVSAHSVKSSKRLFCHGSLGSCFPEGIRAGSVVSISGSGARALCFGLLGNLQSEGWSCLVGFEGVGVRSMSELGVKLNRSLIVEGVEERNISRVISECVESTEFVAVESNWRPAISEANRIRRKLASSGALLILLGGSSWSAGVDYSVVSQAESVVGIEYGHGRIMSQTYSIETFSKRSSLGPNRVWLSRGSDGFDSVLDRPVWN